MARNDRKEVDEDEQGDSERGERRQTGGLDGEEEEGIGSKEGRREDGTAGAGKTYSPLYKAAAISGMLLTLLL
jgi:hypothetical protein